MQNMFTGFNKIFPDMNMYIIDRYYVTISKDNVSIEKMPSFTSPYVYSIIIGKQVKNGILMYMIHTKDKNRINDLIMEDLITSEDSEFSTYFQKYLLNK